MYREKVGRLVCYQLSFHLWDQDFLFQLYTKYQRLMFSTVRKYLTDPQEVEDVVQDALVKMIEIVSKLREMDC